MRPKFVMFLIGITVLLIGGLFVVHRKDDRTNDSQANNVTVNQTLRNNLAATATERADKTSASAKANAATSEQLIAGAQPTNGAALTQARKSADPTETLTHEEYVEKRVGELSDLGMTDDPESLKIILSEINNADGEIRKAAIEATKQFGSADAIPKLEEALASADVSDKQDIQEAIEFLKLPSFLAKRN